MAASLLGSDDKNLLALRLAGFADINLVSSSLMFVLETK